MFMIYSGVTLCIPKH